MFEVCDSSGESTRATVDGKDLTPRGGLDQITTGATGFCGIRWHRSRRGGSYWYGVVNTLGLFVVVFGGSNLGLCKRSCNNGRNCQDRSGSGRACRERNGRDGRRSGSACNRDRNGWATSQARLCTNWDYRAGGVVGLYDVRTGDCGGDDPRDCQ